MKTTGDVFIEDQSELAGLIDRDLRFGQICGDGQREARDDDLSLKELYENGRIKETTRWSVPSIAGFICRKRSRITSIVYLTCPRVRGCDRIPTVSPKRRAAFWPA